MSDWGGIAKGDLSIGVTRHSERKSPAIYVHRGSVVYTVAYCRSEEEANRFWEALIELVEPRAEGSP